MNADDHQAAVNRTLARIIGRRLRSGASKALLSEVLKDAIHAWAGEGRIRKRLAAPALWAASRLGRTGPEKEDGAMGADVGTLLTALARKANATGGPCPEGPRGEAIDAFLKSADFGEILEMVEGAGPRLIEGMRTFNEQFWKYPAKAGALTAAANSLLNTSIEASREILRPIDEQFSPDLLADILLSTVSEIKGAGVAGLVNTVCELIRRVHTGSLRLGTGGRPLFQAYLTDFFTACLPGLKPELLEKARVALAEDGEAWANAFADALRANPAILLSFLSSAGSVASSRARALSRKLSSVEEDGREGVNAAISESVSDLDTYAVAGLINALLGVVERVHDARPDIVATLAGGIADSIDEEKAGRICRWLVPDLLDALGPLAGVVMQEIANRPGRSPAAGYATGSPSGPAAGGGE